MEELEMDIQLRKKGRELQHAFETKIMEIELQRKKKQKNWLGKRRCFGRKWSKLSMKAKQESSEERLASMDRELAVRSSLKVPKQ